DANPAWAPDSKTLAFFSNAGEVRGASRTGVELASEQKQLWTVNADGSGARKLTSLSGYAARPAWSHDGKQVAFLYIEGAGGGGPLLAAPTTTGIIDKAIHNQRIAFVDVATGQLRQVSSPDLHIYDFDWSPDNSSQEFGQCNLLADAGSNPSHRICRRRNCNLRINARE